MTIISNDGWYTSDDQKLITFHNTRDNPIKVRCIKDNPRMHGFGRKLKCGDIVEINGTIHNHLGFCVCVPSECAFYEYTAFEIIEEK